MQIETKSKIDTSDISLWASRHGVGILYPEVGHCSLLTPSAAREFGDRFVAYAEEEMERGDDMPAEQRAYMVVWSQALGQRLQAAASEAEVLAKRNQDRE